MTLAAVVGQQLQFPNAMMGPSPERGGNSFLEHARSMCFETPEKSDKPLVVEEDETKTSPSAAKKLCSSSEKFLKKLSGDTSVMRDSVALNGSGWHRIPHL